VHREWAGERQGIHPRPAHPSRYGLTTVIPGMRRRCASSVIIVSIRDSIVFAARGASRKWTLCRSRISWAERMVPLPQLRTFWKFGVGESGER